MFFTAEYLDRSAHASQSSTLFTRCTLVVLLLLIGCGKKDAVQVDVPVTEAAPPASVAAGEQAAAVESIAGDSIVVAGDSKETSRRWSSSIKAQWSRVATMLVSGEPRSTAAASLAEQIQMISPERLRATKVYEGQTVKIVEVGLPNRVTPDDTVQVGVEEFIANIRELLVLSPSASQEEVHFKLFGIQRSGDRLKTRQRLSAVGNRNGKPVRTYALVNATWSTPQHQGDDGSPQLIEFTMQKLVRSEFVSAPALFQDVADNVLGGNAAWHEQLRMGMNGWSQRIERSLNPDFLGYHGIAIGDVDGDNLEDVYLCQPGGLPNLLFRHQPDGTAVDISQAAGVDWLDNSTGALLVDLDNDGDKDLAVATKTAFLLMQNNGAGKFALRERLAIAAGYSPTAADFDSDGDLDLFLLRYAGHNGKTGDFPTPHPFHDARNGGENVLLQNQGSFRFADVTKEKGLGETNVRFSFAASWEDYDNDGDIDLYVANDFGPNQLFQNEGARFIDQSSRSDTQDWGFGMSATWSDYDRDGLMDLYVSSMFSGAGNQIVAKSDFNPAMPIETRQKYLKMVRGNTLLRNAGKGSFLDVTDPMSEGFGGWAWGTKFADLNNDGWEDLYVGNGYISQPDKDDL